MNNFITVKTDEYDYVLVNLSQVTKIEPVMNGDGGCRVHFNTPERNSILMINDDFEDIIKKIGAKIKR